MTAKSSRRVVIINNIKSDRIEQAIFILRGKGNLKPDSLVLREAQEIIDNYVHKISGTDGEISYNEALLNKKKNIKKGLITTALVIGALTLTLLFKYFGA